MISLIALFVAIAFLMIAIIKFKMNPTFALLGASALLALIVQMPLNTFVDVSMAGASGAFKNLGYVIVFGAIFGAILAESGGIKKLADTVFRLGGEKFSSLAVTLLGYIVGIPVFMGTAYVILNPMLSDLAKRTKKNTFVYIVALVVGLGVASSIVIPTPGPLALANALGANLGWFLIYSIVVSLPGVLLGGWLLAEATGKYFPDENNGRIAETASGEEPEGREDAKEEEGPSAGLVFALLMVPIGLIMIGTILPYVAPNSAAVSTLCYFLTCYSGTFSLIISTLLALAALHKYIKKPLGAMIEDTFNKQGSLVMVLSAGSAFEAVIGASGVSDYMVTAMTNWNLSILLLGFLFTFLMKAAIGSATTSLITAASIFAPIALEMGVNPVLMGLAIGCGGLGSLLPTDGGFWLVQKMNNLSMKAMFVISGICSLTGVVGCVIVFFLNMFSGVLPGLH